MTMSEKQNWIMNLEEVATQVKELYGSETVDFVLGKYNAKNIYQLSPCDYSDVFSELYGISVDN